MSEAYAKALTARCLYRSGAISKSHAERMAADYAREFNAKSRDLAKKYGVRHRQFSFTSFSR